MSDDPSKGSEARTDFAEERTEFAEDRTLLANERTFSGWVRTSMAAIGIGLGFHVLFGKLEPVWLPKAIATCFILLGIAISILAERRGSALKRRLSSHAVEPLPSMNLLVIAICVSAGGFALIAAIWALL